MALASTPETLPRRGLKELWADEDGTASVEFLVLLPAYLLFIAALFSLSFLVMTHQTAQQAARVDGWLDGKNSGVLFMDFGTYDPGTLDETNPAFVDDDFTTGAGNNNRQVLRALLENRFGSGGHPITQRTRTVRFTYTGLLLGAASFDLLGTSTVYTFTDGFEYPAHEANQRTHYFATEGDLRPRFDPAEGPNNTYLSRRVNSYFDTNEGIWDRSAETGRIGGSVDSEHRRYSGDRP